MLAGEVADVERFDRVCRLGGGFRMGPFELIDLIGLDVNLSVARSFYSQGGEPDRWRPSPIQEGLVAAGRLGRKSGQGFYDYSDPPNPASAVPSHQQSRQGNSGAAELTLDPHKLAEIDPAGPAILPRLFAQIANEAAFAREEEIASDEDMETAMKLGFNWPLGPLAITDLIAPGRAVEILNALESEKGAAYTPAPLLVNQSARSSNINSSG